MCEKIVEVTGHEYVPKKEESFQEEIAPSPNTNGERRANVCDILHAVKCQVGYFWICEI